MTATEHDLENWIGSWAEKAKDYAHVRDHFVKRGESPEPHREHLRYKLRLEGWASAMTFWYYVEQDPQGRLWRHLEIQQSVSTADPHEAISQSDVNAHKAEFLGQYTPIVKLFYPLHEGVEAGVEVHAVRPVHNPETRQVVFRTPIVAHFLVRHDSTEHVLLGGRNTSGRLLDASGREISSAPEIRNIADTVNAAATSLRPKKAGKVIPFQEGATPNRKARRKARKTKKKG